MVGRRGRRRGRLRKIPIQTIGSLVSSKIQGRQLETNQTSHKTSSSKLEQIGPASMIFSQHQSKDRSFDIRRPAASSLINTPARNLSTTVPLKLMTPDLTPPAKIQSGDTGILDNQSQNLDPTTPTIAKKANIQTGPQAEDETQLENLWVNLFCR